jgi:hypothetical protein
VVAVAVVDTRAIRRWESVVLVAAAMVLHKMYTAVSQELMALVVAAAVPLLMAISGATAVWVVLE